METLWIIMKKMIQITLMIMNKNIIMTKITINKDDDEDNYLDADNNY